MGKVNNVGFEKYQNNYGKIRLIIKEQHISEGIHTYLKRMTNYRA